MPFAALGVDANAWTTAERPPNPGGVMNVSMVGGNGELKGGTAVAPLKRTTGAGTAGHSKTTVTLISFTFVR